MAEVMTQIEILATIAALISQYTQKFLRFLDLDRSITFAEYDSGGFQRSSAFAAIETYLNAKQAKRLHGKVGRDSKAFVITDEFQGVKLRWRSYQTKSDVKRYFRLEFHKKHYEIITYKYLEYILEEGKAIILRERPRKLYTNKGGSGGGHGCRSLWTHVIFEHPATFDTLVMDPEKKREIIDDLINFLNSKDYYANIGKVWKRGYLLYGPPGTGKSTLIAAMANFLDYDVYDLELTAVKDNTQLRELLINTSPKSVIVIEDIDCSLNVKGQRQENDGELDGPVNKISTKKKISAKKKLSGLLNSIDGLWSTCGGEKIFVFKTNYIENLDPALIRTGRIDKRIKMSYCNFEEVKKEDGEEVKAEKGNSVKEDGETEGWTAVGGTQSTSSSSQDKWIACVEGH